MQIVSRQTNEIRPAPSTTIHHQTWLRLLAAILMSLALKISLFIYKFNYAYLERDQIVVSSDEYEYLSKATSLHLDSSIGQHWLYNWLNMAAYQVFGNTDVTYISMCLLNIVLSCITPVLLLPIVRALTSDEEHLNKIFLTSSLVLLFWPAAIWLSVSNLKDTLLAMLLVGFVAIYLHLFRTAQSLSDWFKPNTFVLLALGTLNAYAIFSLRSYMGAILFASILLHLFFSQEQRFNKILFAAAFFSLIVYMGFSEYILNFLNWDTNWLINNYAAEEIDRDALLRGENSFHVNYTLPMIAMGIVRFYFNPFPYIAETDLFSGLLMVQTAVSAFFVIPFLKSFAHLFRHRMAIFYYVYFAATTVFYAMAEAFSGPRQRFGTVDILSIILVAYALYGIPRTDGKQKINAKPIVLVLVGLAINIAFLLYTSKVL